MDENVKTQPKSVLKRASLPKSAKVDRMLRRKIGATLAEIGSVTHWQPHSCRAFLSTLRKKGAAVLKEERPGGESSYRIEA
jgi:hypothetical protein